MSACRAATGTRWPSSSSDRRITRRGRAWSCSRGRSSRWTKRARGASASMACWPSRSSRRWRSGWCGGCSNSRRRRRASTARRPGLREDGAPVRRDRLGMVGRVRRNERARREPGARGRLSVRAAAGGTAAADAAGRLFSASRRGPGDGGARARRRWRPPSLMRRLGSRACGWRRAGAATPGVASVPGSPLMNRRRLPKRSP